MIQTNDKVTVTIPRRLYDNLVLFGILPTDGDDTRKANVGASDYSRHIIQAWAIIQEYGLNYWDGDIVKRVLRKNEGEDRATAYNKIIHICRERLRQIKVEDEINKN